MSLKVLEYGLLALLLWSPLPAASVEAWAVFGVELAVAVLAAAWVLADPKPRLNPHLPPLLKRTRPLAAAVFGFLLLQVLPLPVAAVRLLAPAAVRFRELYDPGFAGRRFTTLSVSPSTTVREALFLAALFLLGWLVLRAAGRGRRIRAVIVTLVVSGVVNGNHFSGYLEMIIPLALGLAVARMNMMTFGVQGFREKVRLWTSKGVLGTALLFAAAAVMALAILLSNSRSGVVVLAFTVFLFFGLTVVSYSRLGFRQPWVGRAIRATVLAVTVMAVLAGVGSTVRRFALDDILHEDRPLYWANTADMIGDFPVFGTGLGTFASAYNAYETRLGGDMALIHAHNDYLELAAELGVLGALLLLGLVLSLAVRAFLVWRGRRNAQARALALGGIVSLAGAGLHAFTDFNFHIPANMVLFTVILALTVVMAHYRKS
ncbi:MAG: O-antigen ligase family protein [Acidobacteria bacterium]|nr:O-antigen ligase family protein [Acidobacteriota bacterium]